MSKLYFRYGAMGSGKTAALLQVAYNYEQKGMKIVLIKPSIDTKGKEKVISRIGIERTVDVVLLPTEKIIDRMEPIKPEIKVTQRRLSEEEVLEIYNKIHNFNYSPRQIIQEYGISKSNVSAIKKLKIHSHLAGTRINPETNRLIIMRRKE